jgi:cobalamin synthase
MLNRLIGAMRDAKIGVIGALAMSLVAFAQNGQQGAQKNQGSDDLEQIF